MKTKTELILENMKLRKLLARAAESLRGGLETAGGELEHPWSIEDRKLVNECDAFLANTPDSATKERSD